VHHLKAIIAFNVGLALMLLLCGAYLAEAQSAGLSQATGAQATGHPAGQAKSLTEVNKQLSNPISSIWSLTVQQNTYWVNMPIGKDDRNLVNLQFQPVMPVALTDDWNLINRPVLQLLNSTPYMNGSGRIHRVAGFGDTIFVTMLSPSDKLVGNWLLAAGPTFIFPTASNSRLGQN
jgi:hypothetical protein